MEVLAVRELELEDLVIELRTEINELREQRSVALAMLHDLTTDVQRFKARNLRLIEETRALREALFALDRAA